MTMYRVSILDPQGVVAHSATTETLSGVAQMMLALGDAHGEPWAKPLLDEYGKFTVSIRRPGGAPLLDGENERVFELMEEHGARVASSDDEIGLFRWANPERQT